MKKYIISGLLALALVVGVSTTARAATVAELQAMIAQLTAQIAAMQGQSGTFDETPSKGTINSNLAVGSRGPDVVTLQNFLVSEGFLTIPNGLGKGYFGQLTKSAVTAYQASVGLEATGFVGPTTRAKINAMLDGHDAGGDVSTDKPSITIIYPKGGEVFGVNDRLDMVYATNRLSDKATLHLYSTVNGNVYSEKIGRSDGKDSRTIYPAKQASSYKYGKYKIGICDEGNVNPEATFKPLCVWGNEFTVSSSSLATDLVITNVAGMAAGNFEIDLNSKAGIRVNGIGTDPSAIKVYVGGIESTVIQASGDYLYFKTPTDGLVVGSSYDLYLKKGSQRSNTVKVKVLSKVTVVVEPNEPLRVKSVQRAYDSRVTILPNGEELLFAVGVEVNKVAYANALEVRFKKVSGSGNFNDYVSKISLVDWANRPMSSEGGVSYDGDTTIYKFTKLAHKMYDSDGFYVKIKAKSDMDKTGQFTMTVPKDGLRVGDNTFVSGTVTNTITFDPTYTLKKNTTTAQESYVKITNPNSGGIYRHGEFIEIRYQTNLNNTNSEGVTLQLFKTTKESESIWQPVLTIASKLMDGKYSWEIPSTLPEGDYNIYAVGQGVLAGGQSVGDYSDKPITIKSRTER